MRGVFAWLYVGLLVLFPFGNLLWRSVQAGAWPLADQLAKPEARHAMVLTAGVAGGTVLVSTIAGVLLALVLVRSHGAGRWVLSVLTDLPMTLSPVVVGFVLFALYRPDGWLGLLSGRVLNAWPALLLASLVVTLPLIARELTPLLRTLGDAEEAAALTLGASPWQTFRRVTLPALAPGLARGMTLTLARALGEFGAAIVVSGNIMGETQTLTLWVHQEAGDFNLAGAYAGSLVLAAASIAAFLVGEQIGHLRRDRGLFRIFFRQTAATAANA